MTRPSPPQVEALGPLDLYMSLCSNSASADQVGDDENCPFCPVHLSASHAAADRVLACGPGVNLLPTVGMLVRGYLLVSAREHVLSMAELGAPRLRELDSWLDAVRSTLTPSFGQYITFEHGSCLADRTGSCIEHAHMHLIPMAEYLSDQLRNAASWDTLPDFAGLARYGGASYAYLHLPGVHLVLANPRLGSQWIRRQVAAFRDRDDWDWSLNRDDQELKETLYAIDELEPLETALAAAAAHHRQAGP